MTPRTLPLVLALPAFALLACGDNGGGTADTTQSDTAQSDTTTTDTAVTDTAVTDSAVTDVTEDTVPNDLGFTIRYPQTHTLTCPNDGSGFPAEDLVTPDADWLCTFAYGADSGYVYIRATPTRCVVTMSGNPVYEDCAGWIALDGVVTAVTDAGYDWGGNHHNDSLTFTRDGKRFDFDHSSYGWGYRSCQDPDCIVVRDSGGTILEDGCTMDRTLPAVCQQIGTDGTWGSFEDVFAPCAGDPNYQ